MAKTSEYYAGLITSQYSGLPRYQAVVQVLTNPFVDLQQKLDALSRDLDLDYAIGDQLDIIGGWVGLTRKLPSAITGTYLEWDGLAAVGFDGGRWQGAYDPATGLVSMGDEEFRRLIKTKIRVNFWDGSMEQLISIWDEFLPSDRNGMIVDNGDMTLSFGYEGGPLTGLDLAVVMIGIDLLKPAAVRVFEVFQAVDGSPLFVWDSPNSAWDGASWSMLVL